MCLPTHLFTRHGILQQTDVRELGEALQGIEIGELAEVVLREDEGVQIRQRLGQTLLYT